MATPRARTVLRNGAGRHVNVQVAVVQRRRIYSQGVRLGLHPSDGRLGALLHHIAELSREDEFATASHAARLDKENVTSPPESRRGRWRRPGCLVRRATSLSKRAAPKMRATSFAPMETFCAAPDAMVTAALRRTAPILPLQAPHARLAGIVDDETTQGLFGDLDP